MKTATMDIGDLLKRVDKGEVRLPEIQRGYIWKPSQVAGLIDSLYRSYPSGSLLLWETDAPIGERDASIQGPNQAPLVKPQYLLDGQQRLTSLFRVWSGDERARVVFNVESERFQIESAATRKDKRWVVVHELLNDALDTFELATVIAADSSVLTPADAHKRLERVKKILDYPYHVEIVDNLAYEEVTEIFVRVNSQGRALRKVDLALATLSARWPGVIGKLEERVAQNAALGYRHLDVSFCTRCLAALATETARFDGFAASSTDELARGWEKTNKGLDHLLPILRNNASIVTSELIPSVNALVPLVAYLGSRPETPMEAEESKAILYWMFGAFLLGRYNQSADTVIAQDVAAVRADDPLRKLFANLGLLGHRLAVTEEALAGRGAGSPYFLLSYLAARQEGARDWFFGVEIATELEGSLKLEYHHIHPRARLKELYSKAEINDLSNLAFISSRANKKISNRRPADYFPEISEDDLSRHFVPLEPDLRSPEAFPEFVARRRSLLAAAMTELLDSCRPTQVSTPSEVIVDPVAGESLEMSVYSSYPLSSNGQVVFVARTRTESWEAAIPLIDLISFVEDLKSGLAANMTIGSDTSEVEAGQETIEVLIGPLRAVGALDEWVKVLDRELGEVAPVDAAPAIRTPSAWEGQRVVFPVLDSE